MTDLVQHADFPKETQQEAQQRAGIALDMMQQERARGEPVSDAEIARTQRLAGGVAIPTVATDGEGGITPAAPAQAANKYAAPGMIAQPSNKYAAPGMIEAGEQPSILSDTGNMLAAGAVGLVRDANEVVRKTPVVGESIGSALDKAGQYVFGQNVDAALKDYAQRYTDKLSDQQKTALGKNWWDDEKGTFGPAFSDWRSYYGGFVQSLPGNVALILPAMSLARATYASKLEQLVAKGMTKEAASEAASKSAALTGALAGKVLEGLQQAGDSSISVREQILAMNEGQLKDSDALKALMAGGMSFEQARAKLADDASTKAFVLAGTATAVFSGAGDYVLAKAITGGIKGGVLKRLGLGALAEGPLEEFPQSYLSKVAENKALQSAAPGTPLTKGAMNEGLGGAVVGALQGGAMTAALGHSTPEAAPQPQPQPQLALDFGDGKVVRSPQELERLFAPMHVSEREPALVAAMERTFAGAFTPEERDAISHVFANTAPSEQAKVIGEQIFGQEASQEGAGATQEEAAPTPAPAAPVPAKALVRTAKKRLDELHKQAIEADPQLSHIDAAGSAVFLPGNNQHLTPDQEAEYQFLTANMENPEALAKRYDVKLAPESPTKAAKEQQAQGKVAPDSESRAPKNEPSVQAGNPAPAPTAAAAVKTMEGDIKSLVQKRAPAASSAVAGTVAKAAAVLDQEQTKTTAAAAAIEKSKAIEAQRAAKKATPQVEAKPAAATTTPSAASTAEPAAPAKVAPKKAKVDKEAPKVDKPEPKVDKAVAPKEGPIAPKLGPKGEAAVAKSKAVQISKAEKALIGEVKSVLKKYPGTKTPVALVQRELGIEHSLAKNLVARAKGEKVDADFARKHVQREGKTTRVSVGLAAGNASPLSGSLGREIKPERAESIIDDLAQRSGVRIVNRERGVGAYLQYVEGSLQVDVDGTPEQVRVFMDMVGYALQQTEVIATRLSSSGTHHAVDAFAPQFADLANVREFFDAFLKRAPRDASGDPIAPGFQQTRMGGEHALRFLNFGGLWDRQQLAGILAALEQAADETGIQFSSDAVARAVEFRTTGNDWASADQGQTYLASLHDAGRVQERSALERRYAPSRTDEEVARDFARKSQLAVDPGAQREGRNLSREDQTAHAALASAVGDKFGGEAQARSVLDIVTPDSAQARLAQKVAEKFGQKLFFFRNHSPETFDFDGVAPDGSKYIFINATSERPTLMVAGHELLHKLRQSDEPAYQALLGAIRGYFNEKGQERHGRALSAALAKEGTRFSETKYEEEFLADAVGDLFLDPHFWDELGKREPSLFRRILAHVFEILDSVLDFLTPGDRAGNTYFTDLNRAREIVADSLSKWVRAQPEYKETTLSNAFSRWFGQSKITEDGGVPRIMYHGTARVFRAFRGQQANAIFFSPAPSFAEVFAKGGMGWVNEQQEAMKRGFKPFDESESRELRNAAPMIIPAFVKAENPFDYDNAKHIAGLSAWLHARFKSDQDFMAAQRLLGMTDADHLYESMDSLVRAVKNGQWMSIENALTQRYIKMHEHDGFYMMEDGEKNVAVYSPTQVKSIFNDKFDEGPDFARQNARERMALGSLVNSEITQVGLRVANDPNKLRKLHVPMSDMALDWLHKRFGKLSPMGLLPDVESYLAQRAYIRGLVAKSQEAAKRIADLFNGADEATQKQIYNYWTNAYAPSSMIADAKLRQEAVDVKRQIEEIGEQLVKRGLLESETFEANKGKYLPRIYLKHLLDKEGFSAISTGKKPDMAYLKKRTDIEEDVRLALLGEIRDPGFLGAMAVGKPLRDIALMDFLHAISQNEQWTWKPSIVDYKGQRVSVKWIESEANRMRQQIGLYTDKQIIARAQQEIADLEKALQAAQATQGDQRAPADFTEVPDLPRYGLLRGMMVRNEIKEDLVGSAQMSPDGKGWAENFLGYGGVGTKLTQLWKASKVSLNPPAQIRNAVSNIMLLHLSGVPFHMIPVRLAQAIKSLRTKDRFYDIAQKYGLNVGTFAAQELYHVEQKLLNDKDGGGPMALLRYAKLIASKAGDVYQLFETVGKLAKVIDEMERRGVNETTAILEADRWLLDYSLVPKNVRYLRNAPVGMPFLTFYYKLAPLLLEVALKYPWRFAPYVGMAYMMPMIVAGMVGAKADDLDKLKKSLAEWLRDKQHVYVLPWKDDLGRWQFLDLSYFFPWTMFTDAARDVKDGNVSELIKTVGLFSGPMPDMIMAIGTGKDHFTGRDIANAGDPTSLKIGSWLTWLYTMAMPPIITNRGFIGPDLGDPIHSLGGKMPQALSGTTNKYGDPRATVTQAILGAVGVNMYPVDPNHSRASEIRRLLFEMNESKRLFIHRMQDHALSDAERVKLSTSFNEEFRRRAEALQKFAVESEVPENLKK